jgi:hypothetical protein
MAETAAKKRRVRVKELDSVGGVASEMKTVYRRVRHGEITPAFGRILVSILTDIRAAIESHEIEQRLEAIEAYVRTTSPEQPWKPRVVS